MSSSPEGGPATAGVLFDLGNTLVRLDCGWLALAASALAVAPIRADELERTEAAVRHDHEHPSADAASARAAFPAYLREVGRRVGLDPAASSAFAREAMAEHSRRPYGLWDKAERGAAEVLARLARGGVRLGVVSNNDGRARALVDHLGFAPYLAVVVDSAIVGVRKPDARIFTPALRALDLAPGRCLYVGDSYGHDVVGARAAGLRALLYDPLGVWQGEALDSVRTLGEVGDRVLGPPGRNL